MLSNKHQEPSFYLFVLTDELAVPYYCATLVFHESVAVEPVKHDEDDIDDESINMVDYSYSYGQVKHSDISKSIGGNSSQPTSPTTNPVTINSIVHHQVMYAPKCLLIISRHNYPEVLKVTISFVFFTTFTMIYVFFESITRRIVSLLSILYTSIPLNTVWKH